jgi:hypothetical protein
MADNPFYKNKEAEFKMYALAFLRKLKYQDYELIVEEDRATATEKHREEFNEQESRRARMPILRSRRSRWTLCLSPQRSTAQWV